MTPRALFRCALTAAVLAAVNPLHAWLYRGARWADGDVVIVVHMSDENAPNIGSSLFDGSTSWDEVVRSSMAEWNEHLDRITLVEGESTAPHAPGNGVNEVFFAKDIYGEEFGENVLGVTLSETSTAGPNLWAESDIVINTDGPVWNSYRGPRRAFSVDLRRVATHELGHLLGLDHPDEDFPAQEVDAVMNSTVSNTDVLQADDIAGAVAIYSSAASVPEFTQDLNDLTVEVGELVRLEWELDGQAPPPPGGNNALSYFWFFPNLDVDSYLFTFQDPDLFIGAAQPYDAGTYTLLVDTLFGTLTSESTLTVNPVTTSAETKMANLSTRAFAGSGSQTLQVGFVVAGTGTKRVLVRAVGPTLSEPPFNLPDTHRNPRLSLVRVGGGTIATNDDWETNTTAAAEIIATTKAVGGFELLSGSQDAVVLVDLEPGAYTALVEGDAGADGLVIVEAYDVDLGNSTSKLTNLSTRGFVGTGLEVMVAGLVVAGPGPRTYLVRAIGDTLADFGVAGTLDDTLLTVFQGPQIIRIVDDWDDPLIHQPMLVEAMEKVGAFPIPHDLSEGGVNNRQESIVLLTLNPDVYTLQVSGWDDSQTGVALIEIYDYPEE